MNYSELMRRMAFPLNYKAHCACLLLEALGYRFCVDYGYANAEDFLTAKTPHDYLTEDGEIATEVIS